MRLIDADKLKEKWSDSECSLHDYTNLHFIESIDNSPTINEELKRHEKGVVMMENTYNAYEIVDQLKGKVLLLKDYYNGIMESAIDSGDSKKQLYCQDRLVVLNDMYETASKLMSFDIITKQVVF